MSERITIRLDADTLSFLESARGDVERSVAIRKILQWLQPYGALYVQNVLGFKKIKPETVPEPRKVEGYHALMSNIAPKS